MNVDELIYKDSLIPVVTQDINGNVLMLAYATKEAVRKTIETKKAYYWSRSRKKLWMKGEESGNTQDIIDVYPDCDKDTLLYVVKQSGGVDFFRSVEKARPVVTSRQPGGGVGDVNHNGGAVLGKNRLFFTQ